MAHGAARAERMRLGREHELGVAPAREVPRDLLGSIAGAKDETAKALREKLVDQDVEKGAPGDVRQALWPVAHHWAQPCTLPAAKHEHLTLHFLACARYHAIVRASPSRRSVLARKPRSDCAFRVSTRRNG